jgi:2-oxoisovalerate dehydrogenase E1 component
VVRTRVGIGGGYGAQHSADPAAFFAQYPGWRIVAPSNSFDLIGLMNTAMTSEDPVLVIEHAALYSQEFPVPAGTLEFAVPFGRAKVYGSGADLLLVSYSWMALQCLEAMRELERQGVSVTLIDLRTLDLPGLDWDCLCSHTRRIGRVLICEQAPSLLSLGTAIAERLHRDCFDALDAPIQRLAGRDVPMPVSRVLERACYPDVTAIVRAAAGFPGC